VAQYQVLFWRQLPSQVRAWDGSGEVKIALPPEYQEAIDRLAMRERATSTEDYLEGWGWGPIEERTGSAQEVAAAVFRELQSAT
jgi:hypothetical protein